MRCAGFAWFRRRSGAGGAGMGGFVSQSVDFVERGVSNSVEWPGRVGWGNSFRTVLIWLDAGRRKVSNASGHFVSRSDLVV